MHTIKRSGLSYIVLWEIHSGVESTADPPHGLHRADKCGTVVELLGEAIDGSSIRSGRLKGPILDDLVIGNFFVRRVDLVDKVGDKVSHGVPQLHSILTVIVSWEFGVGVESSCLQFIRQGATSKEVIAFPVFLDQLHVLPDSDGGYDVTETVHAKFSESEASRPCKKEAENQGLEQRTETGTFCVHRCRTVEKECVLGERLEEIPKWMASLSQGVVKSNDVWLKGHVCGAQVRDPLEATFSELFSKYLQNQAKNLTYLVVLAVGGGNTRLGHEPLVLGCGGMRKDFLGGALVCVEFDGKDVNVDLVSGQLKDNNGGMEVAIESGVVFLVWVVFLGIRVVWVFLQLRQTAVIGVQESVLACELENINVMLFKELEELGCEFLVGILADLDHERVDTVKELTGEFRVLIPLLHESCRAGY